MRMRKILEFLFPNYTCLACGCEIDSSLYKHVCDECATSFPTSKLSKVSAKSILKSLHVDGGKVYLTDIYNPFIYKEPVSKMILALKYTATGQVAETFAPFMAKTLGEQIINYDLIIPVPLAKSRFRERGYNQAMVLAEELLKCFDSNVDICDKSLLKLKKTTPQTDMSDEERKANQKDAYAVCEPITTDGKADIIYGKAKIKGKRILLIDDVLTSGATANECAKVLCKSGAKTVSLLCIARVGCQ